MRGSYRADRFQRLATRMGAYVENVEKALAPFGSRGSLRASLAGARRSSRATLVAVLASPGFAERRSPFQSARVRLTGRAYPCRLDELAHPWRLDELAHPWRLIGRAHPCRMPGRANPCRMDGLVHPWRLDELAHPCRLIGGRTPAG